MIFSTFTEHTATSTIHNISITPGGERLPLLVVTLALLPLPTPRKPQIPFVCRLTDSNSLHQEAQSVESLLTCYSH